MSGAPGALSGAVGGVLTQFSDRGSHGLVAGLDALGVASTHVEVLWDLQNEPSPRDSEVIMALSGWNRPFYRRNRRHSVYLSPALGNIGSIVCSIGSIVCSIGSIVGLNRDQSGPIPPLISVAVGSVGRYCLEERPVSAVIYYFTQKKKNWVCNHTKICWLTM